MSGGTHSRVEYRQRAKELYEGFLIDFLASANVFTDHVPEGCRIMEKPGAWVNAWVFVPDEELDAARVKAPQ